MSINSILKNCLLSSEYLLCKKNRNSKILFYHDVNDDSSHAGYTDMSTSMSLFKAHLEVIKSEGFSIVSKIDSPEKQVSIVFDDGWEGVYEQRDFFLSNNISPTICVAPGLLNKSGYLSEKEVTELHGLGFGFACHSWLHQSLTLYNNNEHALRREIKDSKDYLEDLLSTEINVFCYPNGLFSKKVYELTLQYGYEEIWSVVDGDYYDEVMPKVKRRCLVQFSNPNDLKKVLLGANRVMASKHYKSTYCK